MAHSSPSTSFTQLLPQTKTQQTKKGCKAICSVIKKIKV